MKHIVNITTFDIKGIAEVVKKEDGEFIVQWIEANPCDWRYHIDPMIYTGNSKIDLYDEYVFTENYATMEDNEVILRRINAIKDALSTDDKEVPPEALKEYLDKYGISEYANKSIKVNKFNISTSKVYFDKFEDDDNEGVSIDCSIEFNTGDEVYLSEWSENEGFEIVVLDSKGKELSFSDPYDIPFNNDMEIDVKSLVADMLDFAEDVLNDEKITERIENYIPKKTNLKVGEGYKFNENKKMELLPF